jgi:hypothetical protein
MSSLTYRLRDLILGGAQRGILDVAAPGVGTWEFRFFPNNSYDYVMKSNLLIVGT